MKIRWGWHVYWMLAACTQHGCADEAEKACAAASCFDTLTLHLGPPEAYGSAEQLNLRACFDESCQDLAVSVQGCHSPMTDASVNASCDQALPTVFIEPMTPFGPRPQSLMLTVTDESGKTWISTMQQVSTTVVQPNGPDCSPTCRQAELTLRPQ